MRILTVVGARPQFIKAAAISRAVARYHGIDLEDVIVHTGQHYDERMSKSFFDRLGIPEPKHNLGIGSATHGRQTGLMMNALEDIIDVESPGVLLVHGDTNSTLAGALVATKRNLPLVHVEAGLRSFDRTMPEEVNRVLTDHVSDLLCCPSSTAVDNLGTEGIVEGVHLVGDVMYDVLLDDLAVLDSVASPTDSLAVDSPYVVATIHRASTTDDPRRFGAVVHALAEIATNIAPVVWPVHPRTSDLVAGLVVPDNLHLISPVSYHEMLVLVRGARTVITDSGGLQKEAYWLETPCVTVRDTTEWTETIDAGWNSLVGADAASIIAAVTDVPAPDTHPSLYGDGRSADRIVDLITSLLA
jgi:UDP-N-acetylglucosamine 2-epimerase